MSSPSFSNIDVWLFELAEGNLSQEQVAQLDLFLLQHPEFDVDKDVWKDTKVVKTTEVYPTAQLIKKRPVGFYSAIASTAFILFTFVGCYQLFDLGEQGKKQFSEYATTDTNDNTQLLAEIESLKAELAALKENQELGAVLLKTTDVSEGSDDFYSRESIVLASLNSNNTLNTQPRTNASYLASKLTAKNRMQVDLLAARGYSSFNNTIDNPILVKKKVIKKRSSAYKPSMKSKFHKFSREMKRMVNNPVALKNYRDPQYHVPGKMAQDINFGSVGTLLTTRIQTLSRLQWYGEENEQLINQLSVDGYAYGIRGGLGISINHSMYKDGGINVADVAITYSPKFSVTKRISVEPSIRFKMGNKTLNSEKMSGVSMVEMDRGNVHDFYTDGTQPYGNNLWYKDLGAGLMVNTKWFFAGIQADNLLNHADNIYSSDISNQRKVGTEFIATIGTDWESQSKTFGLSPYIVYRNNESLSEAWMGANARYGFIILGAAISSNLDPAASIGLKFKYFSFTYNIDYTRSYMTNNQSLSHQVSLRFLTKPSKFGQRLLNL